MVLKSRRRGENVGMDPRPLVACRALDSRLSGQPVCAGVRGSDCMQPGFESFGGDSVGLHLHLVDGDVVGALFERVAIRLANIRFAVGFRGVLVSAVQFVVLVSEARPCTENLPCRQELAVHVSALDSCLDDHTGHLPICRLGIHFRRLHCSCPPVGYRLGL